MDTVQDTSAHLLVDSVTGEVIREILPGDRVLVKTSEQIDYYQKNKGKIDKDKCYSFGQDKNFVKVSQRSAALLSEEGLSSLEYSVMFYLISHTRYKSGLVAFGNGVPITKEKVRASLGLDMRTVNKCFLGLIEHGIIAENNTHGETKYFFNPYIQYRGEWINKTLYEMFKNTKWAKSVLEDKKALKRNR